MKEVEGGDLGSCVSKGVAFGSRSVIESLSDCPNASPLQASVNQRKIYKPLKPET